MSEPVDSSRIRNFALIAHIDHGKSTLADRFIQLCGALSEREMSEQVLDTMDIERERGITIKAQSVALDYLARDGQRYLINLVDTPGHVDFSYEVSRSLAACEGALLLVDATQGVEAQSVANCYTAIAQGLEVALALNKMDLPQADAARSRREIEEIIGLETGLACEISAKTGAGTHDLLEFLIAHIPPPEGLRAAPLKALIIDSWFDKYLGVVSLVKVEQGELVVGDKIVACSIGEAHSVDELGVFTPKRALRKRLRAGEIGFVIAGVKQVHGAPVGDTLSRVEDARTIEPLPGFHRVQPRVFAGMFTTDSNQYDSFRAALEKLALNDAALHCEPESSESLGFGFRCGFLGMLHMEIVRDRLEREYQLDLVVTAPSVAYEALTKRGERLRIENPARMPDPGQIEQMFEPIARADILLPKEHLGNVLALCESRRGRQKELRLSVDQASLSYELPMSEIVQDFFGQLKAASRGFASLDYTFERFAPADLVRVDVLINGDRVDALAIIAHRKVARRRGLVVAEKLRELIPRQMFDVAIQAAIGSQVIARKTVKALRKNVLAKCYGGDVTRKRKLLEKQRAGKRRMKQIGRVSVPQSAFLSILKVDD